MNTTTRTYQVVYRAVGGTRAVVLIGGKRYSIDDPCRLVRAGWKPIGGRGGTRIEGCSTSGKTTRYINSLPKFAP